MHTYWVRDIDVGDPLGARSLYGGKGFQLALLKSWGLSVPPFIVCNSELFCYWKRERKFPESFWDSVFEALKAFSVTDFSVRSSANIEDGSNASFAGIFETFLHVKLEEIPQKVEACYRSVDDPRVAQYMRQKKLTEAPQMAVVIQAMIPSQASGVLFTRAPLGNSALVYLEAALGLGEGLVGGRVAADQFWYDRTEALVREHVNEKKTCLGWDPSQKKVMELAVPASQVAIPALPDIDRIKLVAQSLHIEKQLGEPADIEWAYWQKQIFFLQARPITKKFSPLGVYIDTNLSESYPGVSSPMTASFVKRIYTKVFTESLDVLGFYGKRRRILEVAFKDLIGYWGGHLYYKLNTYYLAISSMPGAKKNLETWHNMIGGKTLTNVSLPVSEPMSMAEKLSLVWGFIKLLLFRRSIFEEFFKDAELRLRKLELSLANAEKQNLSKLSLLQMRDGFEETPRMSLIILNDVFVANGLKGLESLSVAAGLDSNAVLQAIRTEAGVASLGPLEELQKLLEKQTDRKGLAEKIALLLQTNLADDETLFMDLKSRGLQDFVERLEQYLGFFGNRSFEELKLERLSFQESPRSFLLLVKWSLENPIFANSVRATQSMAFDFDKIPFLKRPIFAWLSRFTQESIAVRERGRLMRGQLYGWIRRSLLLSFSQLQKEWPQEFGAISREQFFSLTLDQLYLYAEAKLSAHELAEEVLRNNSWLETRTSYPNIFFHADGEAMEPYFLGSRARKKADQQLGVWEGLGASPGIVEGIALVLDKPEDAFQESSLENAILVTRTTDPAWIFLMSRSKGLVAEMGSLLSHTAIVGRELGVPTVVGVAGIVENLKSGDRISIDGSTGVIKLL